MRRSRILTVAVALMLAAVMLAVAVMTTAAAPATAPADVQTLAASTPAAPATDVASTSAAPDTGAAQATLSRAEVRRLREEKRMAVMQAMCSKEKIWASLRELAARRDDGGMMSERLEAFIRDHKCRHRLCTHVPDIDWLHGVERERTKEEKDMDELNAAVNARIAEDEARLLCTHENLYLFRDTDTGVVDGLCPDCGRMPEAIPTGIKIAETNAAMRSECSHTWGNWIYYNTTQHARICTKCSQLVYAAHTIVEADCVTFKHCTVCNGRDTSWQTPYGHILDWEFDDDGWIKSGYTVYKHARRCVRKDNDLEPICDYVVSVSDSDMSARYWEAAENGMHEVYYVCPACEKYKAGDDVECTAGGGRQCNMCNNPNPY